ncbi:hypothetical protein P261_02536 [Lachnospiraceae bacterium TWA4]|nr:hypothetical protein P261_02536 [Lachnospiraceae bacterium TWA4]
MRKEIATIEGKNITVCVCDREDAPVVYSNDFSKSADAVLAECKKMECPSFHLVSITGIRWDEELSPWEHSPIVAKDDHFTGEADTYLQLLENKIVPYVHSIVPNSKYNIYMDILWKDCLHYMQHTTVICLMRM